VDSTLTDTQRRVLETFFSSDPISAHFYLSGGTALAGFYLHHRLSDDIDLFTRDGAQLTPARAVVQASLVACGLEISGRRETDEMLEYKVQGDPHPTHPLVKVDVVRDTEPAFAPAQVHGVIRVDALLSIAVNKVATIFSRGWEVKDYVDLYFILKTKPFDLDTLLPMAAQKDLGFDELQFAANLSRVSTLQGLVPYLQHYMVQPLEADDLIRFCKITAARIFDRHPPRR
jgi:predicted nucleotidyltransferase component of viral defense system